MAELTIQEAERIRLYRERIQDMLDCGLINTGVGRVTVDFTGKAERVLEGVDEDYLRSFLMILRQFTLNDDPVHFYSIYNLVYRKCERPDLHPWLALSRRIWNESMKSNPLGLQMHGQPVSLEGILQLLLYGGMVHSDEEKAAKLRSMEPELKGLLRLLLLGSLRGPCQALMLLNTGIRYWLDTPDEVVPTFSDALEAEE